MTAEKPSGGMDDFTRRYLYLLAAVLVAGLVWWLGSIDFRVREINETLQSDHTLSDYPYTFRVLSLENGIAEVSSPRSAQMSAIQGLRILFPSLQNASAVSDEMMSAQEELARVQSRAGQLVSEQEDVNQVRWVLDEKWLSSYGVYVQ
ncbi:hypothetical protein [Pseudohalioglobus lutimaris]|uniref:hypothetical protein n=1 Tax=Pseudohalioglobus lutimaris TaxID=1737061 RepID=UPI0018DBCC7E|nr:hypothetical protein [Pseudohalioglobus lutimaris]